MDLQPPRWADRFLQWYCNPLFLEEIQGDAHELFFRRVEEEGLRTAERKFIWDVIRFFRWSNIKRSKSHAYRTNNPAMISNYFKTGLRSLVKDKTTSAINIVGLSLAIGCAITVFIFVDYLINQDNFHSNRENIYQIINHVNSNGEVQKWSDVPFHMAPELKEKVPFIEQVVRIEQSSGNFRYNDRVFNEWIWFVDPAFTEMFDFPILYGNRKALYKKEQIFISQRVAQKYFPDQNPVGEQVSVKYENGVIQSYLIGGVFDKVPDRASFWPSVLISTESFLDIKFRDHYDWSYLTDGIFVSLREGHKGHELEKFFPDWVQKQNQSDPEFVTKGFEPVPLEDLARKSFEIQSAIANGGHPAGQVALSTVAILLILLACSNYVNIAVSSAAKRLKEIALRKVMGGTKSDIQRQFLTENVLTCLIAVMLGTGLSYFFFLPGFNSMIPLTIPFGFSSLLVMSLFFAGLLILVGLASGAYPAFYISRFQPVNIFRGSQKFGQKSLFTKVLLTFQFLIAFSTIVSSFVFTDTSLQWISKGWGYDPEAVIAVPVKNHQQYTALRHKIAQNPDVRQVSGSWGHIGDYDRLTTISQGEVEIQAHAYETEASYHQLMHLELLDGRFFKEDSDVQKAVITERFVNRMYWKDPLQQHFFLDSIRYDVIGVVSNFHLDHFYGELEPAFFIPGEENQFNYLTVKTSAEKELSVNKFIKGAWKEIAPDDPYEGFYQQEVMDDFYVENRANIVIIGFVSVLALVLACIGLYGLIAYNISRRMKEFSVRKVLGASLGHITKLINRDYIGILLIAFVLGAPLGFWQISQLISTIYPEAASTGPMPFALATIIMVVSLMLTIAIQVFKVAKNNPAETLRSE